MTHRSCWLIATALLVLALAAPTAFAQTTERSGIEGKVVDESGAVLPGVTVTITSPALQGGTRTTVTDGAGQYRFAALPNGVYSITFELQGFKTVKREEVRLSVGFIATLDVSLPVGSLAETVNVTAGSPVVDVRSTGVSTEFGKAALETVPTTRTIWQVIDMSPGMRNTTTTPDIGGSLMGTQETYSNYGSGKGGNRPTVEGVDVRDADQDASFYYDFGAFEEVQVKAMGNDAEMPLSGTQLITVIKSGGNTFHGKGLAQYESPKLQSNNIDDTLRAKGVKEGNPLEKYYDLSADLGGRIVRDRLWFYGAYRNQRIQSKVIGYTGKNLTDLINYTSKFTGQVSSRHRLVGFVQKTIKDYPERGGSAFVPPESTIHQKLTPLVTKAEWTFTPSDRALVNVLAGRMHWNSNWDAAYPGSGPARYDTVTLRYSGTSIFNSTSRSERENQQYTGTFSYYKTNFLGGNHDFKVGLEDQRVTYARSVGDRGSDGNYQLRLQNGVPWQIYTYNFPFRAFNKLDTLSGFVKDTWVIGRATFNVGVRAERYHITQPAQTHEAGDFSEAATYPAADVIRWTGVQPRIGLSYALTKDNKTVVKATYGRFGFLLNADYGLNFNANALITTVYYWNDLNKNLDYNPGELGAFVSRTGASNRILNKDLKQPYVDEITGSIERQLVQNFSTRFSYVYKKEYRQYQQVNLARPFSVYTVATTTKDPGPDGVLNTADDGGAVTYYDYDPAYRGSAFEKIEDINTPGYMDRFHSIEVVANKRLANDRWQALASFLATRRDMWQYQDFGSTRTNYIGVPQTPNEANFYPKSKTWEWAFKISGSYMLPKEILLASFFSHTSGTAYGRTVRFTTGLPSLGSLVLLMEPTGSRRMPNVNLMSARAEKRLKIGRSTLSLQLDVFNALNSNSATQMIGRSGSTFDSIVSILPPRILRLGTTFEF